MEDRTAIWNKYSFDYDSERGVMGVKLNFSVGDGLEERLRGECCVVEGEVAKRDHYFTQIDELMGNSDRNISGERSSVARFEFEGKVYVCDRQENDLKALYPAVEFNYKPLDGDKRGYSLDFIRCFPFVDGTEISSGFDEVRNSVKRVFPLVDIYNNSGFMKKVRGYVDLTNRRNGDGCYDLDFLDFMACPVDREEKDSQRLIGYGKSDE